MELSQIRYFLEVARSEHITQSAERLHIAQPALSKSIRKLEEEIGVPLFRRMGRNIVLTEYGSFLSEKLTPMMDELDRLPELLRTMAHLSGETVHLNVLAATALVTEAVIKYKKQNGTAGFKLLQNAERDIFDIQITTEMTGHHTPTHRDFVLTEKIFLAVPEGDRFSGRHSVSLREVEDMGFISLLGSKQFRHICDTVCRRAGVRPTISFESDSPAAVINMISANLGVGFWPEFTWGNTNSRGVRLLEIEDLPACRDIIISYRNNKERDTATAEFFEFLKNYFLAARGISSPR